MKTLIKCAGVFFLVLLGILTGCDEEVTITPQNELVALAGEDKIMLVTEEILLDGSASHEKKNRPFQYGWSIQTKPQNSAALLTNATAAKATFTPDVAGVYVVQLKIMTSQFSSTDDVMITVTSNEPEPITAVILNENINVDRTLVDIFEDPLQPDYIVTHDIEVRANLLVMPGVVVAFQQDKGLQLISGSFRAIGNATAGIVFKGVADGVAYWKGVALYSNDESNAIEFVEIRGGGSSAFNEVGTKANLALVGTNYSGASLKIKHSGFSGSGGYGLMVQGMTTLEEFSNNTFLNNTKVAYIPANQLHKIDAVSFVNVNGFVETGGTVLAQGEITWKKLTGAYLVTDDIQIKTGLTIDAGAAFKIKSGVEIAVVNEGYLKSIGTPDLRIIFSSTGNGVYWDGVFFNTTNENNMLHYTEVSNAGLNKLLDTEHKANISIGRNGLVSIENCVIKNGLGYGIATRSADRVNANVALVNYFESLPEGKIYPDEIVEPNKPPVTGVWLDHWSFYHGETAVVGNFYNRQSGQWFNGATSPWAMTNAAFGIHFDASGKFTWLIAEQSPWSGCESWSAEYILGDATIASDKITFDMEYWRSKFINSCDVTQNVDTEVEIFEFTLPYTIVKVNNSGNGTEYWELRFTNPDNSTFSFYRY